MPEQNAGEQFLRWATAVKGTPEGSGRQHRWNAAAGVDASAPWCSTFIAYGLQKVGISPPSSPAYSGSWLEWSGGAHIDGMADAKPGDLLIFDWGDGGITDHVGAYLGGGQYISGNDSNDTVGVSSVPEGNIVGIVRPKGFGEVSEGGNPFGDVAGAVGGAAGDVLGFAGDQASNIANSIIGALFDELTEDGPRVLLYLALVLGGATLVYYGLARSAGADKPLGTPAKVAAFAVTKGRKKGA